MGINLQVERFLRNEGMAATKFGRLAAKDPRLVLDMRNGREIRPSMEKRLVQFMAKYQQQSKRPLAA
jgi:2,4-dienoyl-CoA reductase-like NADH-dependent reductase (Old Yellow Enzyme family)